MHLLGCSLQILKKKGNLHYIRGTTPKRVTSSEVYLRDLAPGQFRNFAAVAGRWRQCPI